MTNVSPTVILTAAAVTSIAASIVATYYLFQRKNKRPPSQWKYVAKVTALHLYPLKSARKINLQIAECTNYGIKQHKDDEKALQLHDRSFVVYDEKHHEFKSARTFPKMILIEMSVHDYNHVAIDAPGMRSLYVKVPNQENNKKVDIILQRNPVFALDCGDEAAHWLSQYIKGEQSGLRLGYHDSSKQNSRDLFNGIDKKMFEANKTLGNKSVGLYSDLTALHLVNQATVDELNKKIQDSKITAENFRPNIIVEDVNLPSRAEDTWEWIKVGDAIFRNVKLCTRCILTTINPETGVRDNGEPLKTLKTYHCIKDIKRLGYEDDQPVMGLHLEVFQKGVIKVGDLVHVGY